MKAYIPILLSTLSLSLITFGCENKAGTMVKPQDKIIEQSQARGSIEAQAEHLLNQAKDLISNGKYSEAIYISGYVRAKLDGNSSQADALIEEAQAGLKRIAEENFKARNK